MQSLIPKQIEMQKHFHDPPPSHMPLWVKCLGMIQSIVLEQTKMHDTMIYKSLNIRYGRVHMS